MSDFKYQLRIENCFPQCAKDSLQFIEQLILARNAGRNVMANSMDLAKDIIAEFIFRERNGSSDSSKNKPVRGLNSIQELQLLEILCAYFSRNPAAVAAIADHVNLRNTVFLSLFPCGEDSRAVLLAKLVSMAVATRSKQVLAAAGLWLQQTGPTSQSGLGLAESIVSDYLVLVPEAVSQLDSLPHLAPELANSFLSAVAELYGAPGSTQKLPPEQLLKVVGNWAGQSPVLCTAATMARPPTSPFFGLVRWCVMAPLHGSPSNDLYSQLHLALLESLLAFHRENLVAAHQLAAIVSSVLEHVSRVDPARVNLSLDRFTQIVIVLLRTGSVSGNIQELFHKMDFLPNSELLENFKMCRSIILSPPYFRLPQRT